MDLSSDLLSVVRQPRKIGEVMTVGYDVLSFGCMITL